MALTHGNVYFHNVEELETVPGQSGLRLQRYPREVREKLGFKAHSRGRFFAHRATGCELRFVTGGRYVAVTLTAMESDATAIVFRGDWAHSHHKLPAGTTVTLFLEDPAPFADVEPEMLKHQRFAPDVWRITFNIDAVLLFHHVEGYGHPVRPPEGSEMPATRWLAYGSSITFGGNAMHAPNAYVQQAALRLGVDVLNKGLPGSCLCETDVADYLSGADWTFATLELGVNLAELATPEEFRERACALIDKVSLAHPDRTVAVLDIYPNRADYARDREGAAARSNPVFREIIREHVVGQNRSNLHYIPANRILMRPPELSSDLVHPSDFGHIAMGERLAEELKPLLQLR